MPMNCFQGDHNPRCLLKRGITLKNLVDPINIKRFKISQQTCSQGSRGFRIRMLRATDFNKPTTARTLAVQMGSPNTRAPPLLNTHRGHKEQRKRMSQGYCQNIWLTQVCQAQLITVNCNRTPGLGTAGGLILHKILTLLLRMAA